MYAEKYLAGVGPSRNNRIETFWMLWFQKKLRFAKIYYVRLQYYDIIMLNIIFSDKHNSLKI